MRSGRISGEHPVALDSLMTDAPGKGDKAASRMHVTHLPSAPLRINSDDEQPKAQMRTFMSPLITRDGITPRRLTEVWFWRVTMLPARPASSS